MNLLLVNAEATPAQAWRNGGGQTRELLAWPSPQDWRLRISRADIATDGPFSAFPEVQRWFCVLAGAGVRLHFPDGPQTLRPGDAPLCFDGALAPGCDLLDGPTQDLNLMLRGGRGGLFAVEDGRPWHTDFRMRGLYTTVAGQWQAGEAGARAVAPHTLLWAPEAAAGDAWRFVATDGTAAGHAWWLAFTPEDPTHG